MRIEPFLFVIFIHFFRFSTLTFFSRESPFSGHGVKCNNIQRKLSISLPCSPTPETTIREQRHLGVEKHVESLPSIKRRRTDLGHDEGNGLY